MRLIGLDVGTTGCKAAVFDVQGHLLASASREYAVDMPHSGWAEQDAEQVWRLAQDALRQAIRAADAGRAVALGLSVQGEAVLPVGAQGQALRPAILGMDTRTGKQNDWLRRRFGADYLFARTGMVVHTVNTLPKLLWLKVHEPDVWRTAARFLLYEDFLIHKMTGQAVISRCLASRTQLYDIPDDRWSPEILSAVELDSARLAAVAPSGQAVGSMRPELAESLGLVRPPLVVTGGHDQACAALGTGLVRPGLAMDSTGTAEVVEVALASPILNETLCGGNISVYAHTVPGLYLAMTLNHSGGISLRWFRDTFCQEEVRQAQATGQDAYDLILSAVSRDPSPLFLMPHFAGSGTPWFDTSSRGAVLGMTLTTSKADLAKALLDGLTYELRINFDLLREGGVAIDEVRAVGGGARSALWLQLKADVLGLPILVPAVTESACWGAALLAGVGAGLFSDAAAAAGALLRLERRFEPDTRRAARYLERYQLYRELYPALRGIQERM